MGPGRPKNFCRLAGVFLMKDINIDYYVTFFIQLYFSTLIHMNIKIMYNVKSLYILIIRAAHSSWNSPSGVILLGGDNFFSGSINTTTSSFDLAYSVK